MSAAPRTPERARCRAAGAALAEVALATLLLGVALAGCGRSDQGETKDPARDELATSCAQVGERLLAVSRDALARIPEADRMRLQGHLGQVRNQYVATCKEQKWPAEARACLIEAATAEAFDACAQALAAQLAPPAPPASPAPAADTGTAPEAPPDRDTSAADTPVTQPGDDGRNPG